ncbi:MAG: DUF3313 family protein [Gammaproteobacteria bacterium]
MACLASRIGIRTFNLEAFFMSYVSGYKLFVFLLSSILVMFFLSSCSGAKQYRRVENSGFLGDYSQLKEGTQNEALYVYVNPKADCHNYSKVLIFHHKV